MAKRRGSLGMRREGGKCENRRLSIHGSIPTTMEVWIYI